MDTALWISWYDMPETGRDDYLTWAHKTYIPQMLKRPGYLWAGHYASVPKGGAVPTVPGMKARDAVHPDSSVPKGDRYILMFGAEHAGVFGNPAPGALHAALPGESRRLLALRENERVNIMTVAEKVDGPEAKSYQAGMTPAPCIQLGSYNCAWQDEEDAMAWYTQRRLPAMSRLTGVVRTRKLASVSGWAKHAVLYEWISLDARNRNFPTHEDGYPPEMKAWTARVRDVMVHAPGSANLACRIWPAL